MFLRFKVRQVLSHRGSAHRGMVMLSMLAIVSVLFSFQNCAEPLRLEGEEFATKADGYSFGYSVKADTLAYMSCSGRQKVFLDDRTLFSFKLGAYSGLNSGIGLSSEFATQASSLRLAEQAKALVTGQKSVGAQLQFSVRRRNNLSEYYTSNQAGANEEGKDYDNILGPLSSEGLVNAIVAAKGQRVNYFGNIAGLSNRRVEGHLHFNSDEVVASDLRARLHNGELLLGMSFFDSGSDNEMLPMSPGDPRFEAYGSGLKLTFARGHGNHLVAGSPPPNYMNADPRVLQTVAEVDLLTPQRDKPPTEANWLCPQELRFLIARPEDNGSSVFCGQSSGSNTVGFFEGNAAPANVDPAHYLAARNVLPVEYWHIDFARKCVVPKAPQDSCYDPSASKPINYQPGRSGYPLNCGSSSSDAYTCPHYVSICYLAVP